MSLTSQQIRAAMGHPIIDADGHYQEFSTCLRDDVLAMAGDLGGKPLVAKVENMNLTYDDGRISSWMLMSEDERRDVWSPCTAWWSMPTKARDRASAHIPRLLHERMDELGIDYSVLFPSLGLTLPSLEDEDVRRLACRVFNTTTSELFAPYADRLTPVAVIPMFSPEEAIDELEHSVGTLGTKAIVIGSVRRPVAKVAREHADMARFALRVETYGIDSDDDYDPFWKRCAELHVPIGVHHTEQGWGSRSSPSRYVYNHIGAFAAGSESIAKALFLGGVTRRFPSLRFAFLEGGMGWAVSLLADLVSHWEKRNAETILELDPAQIDLAEIEGLVRQYGPEQMTRRMDRVMEYFARQGWHPEVLDDWRSCEIQKVDDIADLYVTPFFFGCEADDPLNSLAFDTRLNPFGRPLQCVFGSDFGHWDVPEMNGVVHEAYEAVERGLMDEGGFKDFMFTNPVRLFAGANPSFFEGTVCEAEASQALGAG